MRNYLRKSIVLCTLLALLCSFAVLLHSVQPPKGYTGATGAYCTSCHTTNPLNSAGGSVVLNGFADSSYLAGLSYNFSVLTSHSAADRKRFGFSVIALNSLKQVSGTFSTTNPNAALNGNELSHENAVILTTAVQSFTYDNLTWTAPANPTAADDSITFYFVGNAANGNGSSTGDFIYAGTKTITISQTYTFTGSGNWNDPANWSNNTLPPSTISGKAVIIIDPPANGECVLNVEQHIASGANLIVKDGKAFRVAGNLLINN